MKFSIHRLLSLLMFLCFFYSPVFLLASELGEENSTVSIDFLYINANAGEAAGGHTALRLGDTVFHYQFFPDATFLLVREPWDAFLFLYNELHNRSISIASLPLNLSVATQIRYHFTELLAEQDQFFNSLEQLRREKRLVQALLVGKLELPVNALGFFSKKLQSPYLPDLTAHIKETLPTGFFKEAVRKAEENVQRAAAVIDTEGRLGPAFQERLGVREALRIFSENRGLDSSAFIPSMQDERRLTATEKSLLNSFRDSLRGTIVELLCSRRPDRGAAILLQTARYLAVCHSLSSERLLTLDPFFEDVHKVWLSDEEISGGRLAVLQEDLLEQSATRRDLFFKEERHPEIAYSLLETSRARAWELLRVHKTERKIRILTKTTLPTRPGIAVLDTPHISQERLQNSSQLLAVEFEKQKKRAEDLYGYNLINRNCATELIRSLNSTFPDEKLGRDGLGGWMEPESGLIFIPFLFYEQAVRDFSLQDEQFIQARRLRNLETLYEQEDDLLVWLRESNTLSSTLYQPRNKDTPFLFFTDDSLLLRPILGLMNLTYGAMQGVAGLARVPLDGGEHFNQALRGIFYSLPELTFGNIRKGSYSTGESEGTTGQKITTPGNRSTSL